MYRTYVVVAVFNVSIVVLGLSNYNTIFTFLVVHVTMVHGTCQATSRFTVQLQCTCCQFDIEAYSTSYNQVVTVTCQSKVAKSSS